MEEDEDLPLAMATQAGLGGDPSLGVGGGSAGSGKSGLSLLLNQIITPSPYPQHNSGPTSSRFRNALNRVLQHPDTDVEAWQAVLTEVYSCYKNIPNVHAVDVETQTKLDWVESCYGHFLRYFPYAHTQAVTVIEILMKQSARVREEDGPLVDYYYGGGGPAGGSGRVPKRAILCEQKLEGLLREWLGIANLETGEMQPMAAPSTSETEGNQQPTHRLTGICSWVVELWLLYVKKRARDATRIAEAMQQTPEQRLAFIRDATKQAYEVALPHCCFSHNNQLIWVAYLDFVKGWSKTTQEMLTPGTAEHASATQQQMLQLRSIYQRLVTHPMTGLDQLWHEYEAWERNQSEALALALSQELAPKYQHARTVYLERNRVYNKETELQLGQRLAVPPASQKQSKDKEDYHSQMREELRLLTAWKKRCSYERTNPERLSPSDLVGRIRAAYKEMTCVLTRHPETWQMWATYELFRNASGGAMSAAVATPAEAVSVLQLGQEMIPTSTLLMFEEAHIVELYMQNDASNKNGHACLQVMERALERLPTTLGFVLYQQMVRRYKGIQDARAVFGRARRVLINPDSASTSSKNAGDIGDETAVATKTEVDGSGADGEGVGPGDSGAVAAAGETKDGPSTSSRWMVTNKLDPSIGNGTTLVGSGTTADSATQNGNSAQDMKPHEKAGRITWHLYAAHASIEHRMNRCPEIAARVYELGLRKHKQFLTKASYVMRYAELLLELGDSMNLRALLTRAVAACQGSPSSASSLAALWDMTLRFETILSGSDPNSLGNLKSIERQRRQAIFGPDVEDVATGGYVGATETALIGAQKSSIAEHLIRAEGYDTSSGIVNGLSRTVDVLEVMGLWGSGELKKTNMNRKHTSELDDKGAVGIDDMPGGESDSSYQRRLEFSELSSSGDDGPIGGGEGGSRLLTARERMQQAANAPAGAGMAGGPTTAIMLAIQQMPEWLRPLLLPLPASRLRLPIVAKPPPHLVEIALTTLRQNPLPAERPKDDNRTANGSNSNKRKAGGGDDSSDDENGGTGGSGFGNAFRARQRARMAGMVGQSE